ncbi:hypothetical protein QOZ80_7AG0553040 [Eleusine coracana subsp. coracana]|nr:hypothetical protein QOZ80_7AG0553040 [Eleusine coracana subsp. coracana]
MTVLLLTQPHCPEEWGVEVLPTVSPVKLNRSSTHLAQLACQFQNFPQFRRPKPNPRRIYSIEQHAAGGGAAGRDGRRGENSLQRALLRAEVIVDEAMGRHIKNQAMLQQLDPPIRSSLGVSKPNPKQSNHVSIDTPAAGALMKELIEQILLRFPPDESAPLFRAALVCKPWRRLITSPGFRRRFCEHHHSTPPMLGFFCTAGKFPFGSGETRFIPTNNKSCPTNILPHAIIPSWRAVDTLGRRVLFHDNDDTAVQTGLIVWNPIDGEVRRLPNMPLYMYRWTAALICAAPGCDHRLTDDCSYGPFRVVVVATGRFDGVTYACVYSSEQDAWSEPIYVPHQFHHDNDYVINSPSVHVNNSVYFTRELHVSNFERSMVILEINLEKREASSLVSLPSACQGLRSALMTTQDRTLGLATVLHTRLCMWSRNDAAAGGWSQTRVIELDKLLPAHYSFELVYL